MEAVLLWGLDFVVMVQAWANPPLTVFMRIISIIGSAEAYLLLLPLVYWCVDEKKCLRLGTAVLISVWLNIALKFLLIRSGPFAPDGDLSFGIAVEKLGILPSGCAQNSLVLWIIIASWEKKKWYYAAAAFFCLLVGFSGVYLGENLPADVILGWLSGGLILCGYFFANRRIESLLVKGGPRAGLMAGAALAFAMILYRPSAELLMPAGMILGLGAGYFLNRRITGFAAVSISGCTAKYFILIARFILGAGGMILLFAVSERMILIFNTSGNYRLVVFLRFVIVALWISAGAPWLFRFVHLAESAGGVSRD